MASQVAQWSESARQRRRQKRHGFCPRVRKIPWRRKRHATPVFLPGKFHGQRSLAGYSLWDCTAGHNWVSPHNTHTHTHTHNSRCSVFYIYHLEKTTILSTTQGSYNWNHETYHVHMLFHICLHLKYFSVTPETMLGFWFGFFIFYLFLGLRFFLVIVSLDFPWRWLSCFKTEALALFSPSLICCIYKAFSNEPDVVCKQTPPASRAGGSWVQCMRAAFAVPDWHGDLWSVRPSCLWRTPAFTYVFCVYFSCPGDTLPPKALQWFSGPCGEWTEGPPRLPFLRRETKSWLRSWERRGKWVACFVTALHTLSHLTRPGQCSGFKRAWKLFFKGRVSVLMVAEWKCFKNPLF